MKREREREREERTQGKTQGEKKIEGPLYPATPEASRLSGPLVLSDAT